MTRIGAVTARLGLELQAGSAGTLPTNHGLLSQLLGIRVAARRASSPAGFNDTSPDRLNIALSRLYWEASGQSAPAVSGTGGGSSLAGLTQVTNLNGDQVSGLDILSLGSTTSLSGAVIEAPSRGELSLAGDSASRAIASASFELQGSEGAATITVTQGEALSDIADRVNAQLESTGVFAAVDSNSLVLRSAAYGPGGTVRVELLDIDSDIEISSNSTQIADVQALAVQRNTGYTLAGTVTQAAEQAELIYEGGSGGVVTDDATFTLSGDFGQTSISITKDESLADVATRINSDSGTTGVSAVQSGDDLILRSTEFGSLADVSVELTDISSEVSVGGVNAGQLSSFDVTSFVTAGEQALDGDVTQAAAAAELTYTGVLGGRVASSATFTLSGQLGSAEISVTALESLTNVRDRINQETDNTGVAAAVSGNELVLSSSNFGSDATVAVDVTLGVFNVSGGNGDGTANGSDAEATINGQNLTASGNDFSFTDALGSYEFSVVQGFTGTLDTVTVTSVAGDFTVTGGDGNGNASGVDAAATINGSPLVGNGNSFTVTDQGTFQVAFNDGFSGDFDDIQIATTDKAFTLSGGDGAGSASGTNGSAIINGVVRESDGRQFSVATESGAFIIQFEDSFRGSFDTIEVAPPSNPESLDILAVPTALFRQIEPGSINRSSIRQIQSLLRETLDAVAEDPDATSGFLASGSFTSLLGRQRILEVLASRSSGAR